MLTGGTLPQLYPLLMMAAMGTGVWLSRYYRSSLPLNPAQRLWIGMAAFSGAILAAKLPWLIPGLPGFAQPHSILTSGKTILFGMAGGYAGVELAKKHIRLKVKTGDSFAVPVAASIAVGRLACFFGGCCYGTPTNLPWAVVFPSVDKSGRHPTQLYEAGFHLIAALILASLQRRGLFRSQLIKLYFIAYFCYRLLSETIRPEARIIGGFTAYQWSTLILIPIFGWLWYRDGSKNSTELKTP